MKLIFSAQQRVKIKESETMDKYLNLSRELHEGDGDTNCNWHTWKAWKRGWGYWWSKAESRPSRPQH